jgi:hypothetical protein
MVALLILLIVEERERGGELMATSVVDRSDSREFLLEDESIRNDAAKLLNDVKDVRSDTALIVDGRTVGLPKNISKLIFDIVEALSKGSNIAINSMPREISPSTAAGILDVSRPTFLKRAKEQGLVYRLVGTQKRFSTEDVLQLKRALLEQKIETYRFLREQLEDLDGPADSE